MPRIALLVLLVGLGCVGLLPAGSGDVPASHEAAVTRPGKRPAFSARSVRVRRDRLVVVDLKEVEKDRRNPRLAGRVLIYCDPQAALGLWTAQVGNRMQRATPFLGRERPGAKFRDLAAEDEPIPIYFRKPVLFTLVFLDERGVPSRKQAVAIREVQAMESPAVPPRSAGRR